MDSKNGFQKSKHFAKDHFRNPLSFHTQETEYVYFSETRTLLASIQLPLIPWRLLAWFNDHIHSSYVSKDINNQNLRDLGIIFTILFASQLTCFSFPTSSEMHKPLSHIGLLLSSLKISSVQFISVAQSSPTLWDPMNHSTPGLPVQNQLPESIEERGQTRSSELCFLFIHL